MSVIYGNPIVTSGGGVKLNIDYGTNPPSDTTKLWVPLATKPSAVECSPTLQIGSEYMTTAVQTRPSTPTITRPSSVYHSGKIYAPAPDSKMQIYDTATNAWETITCPIVRDGGDTNNYSIDASGARGAAVIDNKIYYWGHARGQSVLTFYLCYFDIASRTYHYNQSVNLVDNSANLGQTIIGHGTIIYSMGFANAGNFWPTVRYFDVSKNKAGTLADMPQGMIDFGVCSIGNAIYVVGGYWGNYSNTKSNAIYRYDITSNSWTHDGTLPQAMYNTNAVAFGQYIYIFGGANASGTVFNTIYRYDTVSKQVITLDAVRPKSGKYCITWLYGYNIFLTGSAGFSDSLDIDRFTVSTPLTSNHLFLQEDYGYDGLWTALKSKDTDFRVKVINAYLGDSNNVAQLTNAYLYDSKDLKWKSLSGESYVADMQNALNILGVN